MTQIPSDEILEGLYISRVRESENLKTVLELYNMQIHQKKAGPDYHRLKTMVKKEVSSKIYEIGILVPEMEIMKENKTAWTKNSWRLLAMGTPTGSVPEETIAVSATISISVEK